MEKQIFCFDDHGYYGIGEDVNAAYLNLKRDPQSVSDVDNYEDSDEIIPDSVVFIKGTQVKVTPKIVFEEI